MAAVCSDAGKMPEKRESFQICRNSNTKQLKTLLKKLVGRLSRQLKKQHYFPQSYAINNRKVRHEDLIFSVCLYFVVLILDWMEHIT